MAHEVYIGNESGLSRNVNKIYLGDNSGVSRKVKSGYIGDSSGKARLFYFSEYVWNRYTITLKEKRVNYPSDTYVTIKQNSNRIDRAYCPGCFARRSKPIYNRSSKIYNFSDNDFSSFDGYDYGIYYNSNFVYVGFQTTGNSSPYVPVIYTLSKNADYGILNINYVSYSRGIYEYRISGYDGEAFSELYYDDAQGTYIDQVTSDNPSAYPDNGRGSDGYWYVKVET